MIDKDFLQSCTDEQINKGVAWLRVSEFSLMTKDEQNELDYYAAIDIFNRADWGFDDYCANPNDAWHIILGNEISLLHDNGLWEASIDFYGNESEHGTDELLSKVAIGKNPLRAACEVYLLMSNEK